MLMFADRYAQGNRKWKHFNRRWDKAKEGETNVLQDLTGTEGSNPEEPQNHH